MTRRSRSDQQIIEELQRGREALLSDDSLRSLKSVLWCLLKSITPNLFILRWIPEQGEDLYDVLVDGTTVVHVEIPRAIDDGQKTFRSCTVEEYIHEQVDMTRSERRKLDVARELAASNRAPQKTNEIVR